MTTFDGVPTSTHQLDTDRSFVGLSSIIDEPAPNTLHVVEYDPAPTVGPFESAAVAEQWALTHTRSGQWCIVELVAPDPGTRVEVLEQ